MQNSKIILEYSMHVCSVPVFRNIVENESGPIHNWENIKYYYNATGRGIRKLG
jgi:hypothetical protein